MYKRFLTFLAFVSLVGLATSASAAFSDTVGTPYERAFTAFQNRGVVQGYSDGLARPNEPLLRIEGLKVILEAHGGFRDRIAWMKNHVPPLALFTDVDQTQWYAPYIEVAYGHGITTGYPDQSFRPSNVLTVEEAITLLMRTHELAGRADRMSLSSYIENRDGAWFTLPINAAIDRNLIMHRGKLKLGQPITRGQFFDIVYRLQEVQSQQLTAYSGPEPTVTAVVPIARLQVVTPPAQRTAVNHPQASEQYFAITMPTLGVTDLKITHPENSGLKSSVLSVLKYGVGHLFSYPGDSGKIMVYGHSSGYPWDVSKYTKAFRKINQLRIGDKVYVTYAGKLHVYEVTFRQTVDANDNSALIDDGSGEELILYTCWPPDSIAQRYLVHALPVETIALQ